MVVRRPREEVATSVQPVPDELAMRRSLAEAVEVPVPPFAIGNIPEILLVREIDEVAETTPEAAVRKPEREPTDR